MQVSSSRVSSGVLTWLIVPKACDEMLDALLNVLSLEESINSLETLLNQGNDNVGCLVFSTRPSC